MIWSPLVGGITLGAQLPPLPIRVSGDLQAVGFKKSDVITSSIPSTPPWLLARPAVNFTLHCSDKSNTSPEVFKHRFWVILPKREIFCPGRTVYLLHGYAQKL